MGLLAKYPLRPTSTLQYRDRDEMRQRRGTYEKKMTVNFPFQLDVVFLMSLGPVAWFKVVNEEQTGAVHSGVTLCEPRGTFQ